MGNLIVNEIFSSIDGEVNAYYQGCFTTFIRLAGCNLRCSYCDTKKAWEKDAGEKMEAWAIITQVNQLNSRKVTITGGEPLLQIRGLRHLFRFLSFQGTLISIETNGSLPIPFHIGSALNFVVDYKLPSSGVSQYMQPVKKFAELLPTDFIKMVINDRKDYEVAKMVKTQIQKRGGRAQFAFSPVHGVLEGGELIEWCKVDKLFDVIINVQLHKVLNLKEG